MCLPPPPDPCTFPHLPLSLPNPFPPCSSDVWEAEAGIPRGKPAPLPHACKCQDSFTLLPSSQICSSTAVSLHMCLWPWEAPCPRPRCQRCPPGCVRAAWQGTLASPLPLCVSVSPPVRSRRIVAPFQIFFFFWGGGFGERFYFVQETIL